MHRTILKYFGIAICTFALLCCFGQKRAKQTEKVDAVYDSPKVYAKDTIPKEKLRRVRSYEAFCNSLKLGDQVEVLSIECPRDDLLCDSYDGSDGPLH